MDLKELYKEERKKVIEDMLQKCEYPNACKDYFEGIKIKANPEYVEHTFDCGETAERLKKINLEIDFGELVIQDFEGSLLEAEVRAFESVFELINTYVTICIEN